MSKFQIEDHGKYVKPKQDRQCYLLRRKAPTSRKAWDERS